MQLYELDRRSKVLIPLWVIQSFILFAASGVLQEGALLVQRQTERGFILVLALKADTFRSVLRLSEQPSTTEL